MFSATKFVVAGAIVALFGGFLLSGVLTQQNDEAQPAVGASASVEAQATAEIESAEPQTTINSDLLPGVDLVTEEVEPGVFRVDSDGVRDLNSWNGDDAGVYVSLAAGLDGSVWLFWIDSFFRIGGDETHPWVGSPYSIPNRRDDIEVAPDGTLWWVGARGERGLRSFDGDAWTVRLEAPLWGAVRDVEIDSDGSVWAAWQDDLTREWSVGRLEDDGWQTLRTWRQETGEFRGPMLSVGGGGDAWVMIEHPEGGDIWRLADSESGRWESVDRPGADFWRPHVADDGTAWARMFLDGLSRFDGSDWSRYGRDDGLPILLPHDDWVHTILAAAADGSVWIASQGPDDACDGVTNFDGSVATTFLAGMCVADMDVAPDGSLWLQSGGPGSRGRIYVITPEALAANR